MSNRLIERLFERAENDKNDSDFAYFFALLLAAEALAKTAVLGVLAAIEDDTESNRYRLTYQLVRADGLGDWGEAIEDALSGPASQYLAPGAREDRVQLTRLCAAGEWQHEAVSSLKAGSQQPVN